MAVSLRGAVLQATAAAAATSSTATFASTAYTAGDLLVITIGANSTGGAAPVTFGTPTGGTGLVWTSLGEKHGIASHDGISAKVWSAPVPSGQTSTIAVGVSVAAGNNTAANCWLFQCVNANTTTPTSGAVATYSSATVDPTGTALQKTDGVSGGYAIAIAGDWTGSANTITPSLSGVTSTSTATFHEAGSAYNAALAHGVCNAATMQAGFDLATATGDWAAILLEIAEAATAFDPPLSVPPMQFNVHRM